MSNKHDYDKVLYPNFTIYQNPNQISNDTTDFSRIYFYTLIRIKSVSINI